LSSTIKVTARRRRLKTTSTCITQIILYDVQLENWNVIVFFLNTEPDEDIKIKNIILIINHKSLFLCKQISFRIYIIPTYIMIIIIILIFLNGRYLFSSFDFTVKYYFKEVTIYICVYEKIILFYNNKFTRFIQFLNHFLSSTE